MEAVNPATGERIDTYEEADLADVERSLDDARTAFRDWRDRPLAEREELIQAAADVLRENKREYAELMTEEMGKPITQAVGEVEKCAWVCEHYAENAHAYLEDDHYPSPPGTRVKTVYEPLGVVLAVMPWNFPFWQVFRFVAPYLTAGNVGILKHARTYRAVPSPSRTSSARRGTPRASSSRYWRPPTWSTTSSKTTASGP